MTKDIKKNYQVLIEKIKIYNPKADFKKIKKAKNINAYENVVSEILSA